MPIVAVFHPRKTFRTALKRGVTRPYLRVITCRTAQRVDRLIQSDLVDAVVADVKAGRSEWFFDIAERYPSIPCYAASRFRPGDGRLMTRCVNSGVGRLLVEGVDDPVAGELVSCGCATAGLLERVADAPRLLRLREDLQRRVWFEVFDHAGSVVTTGEVASTLGVTREHLSREFGAGGAPNLKRVIDLVRILRASLLLSNPGHSVARVSEILKFSSASHFSSTARRLADTTPRSLADLGPRGILARFIKGKTRSRL